MSLQLRLRHVALASALPLMALGAQAQELGPVTLSPLGAEGGVVGLGLMGGARYSGGEDQRLRAVPILGYQWSNGWFASTTQGVGVNLSSSPDLQFGPRLTVDMGRREHDDGVLRGMGNVKPAVEGGGFVNVRALGDLWLNASLRAGSGEDHRGARLDLGATWSQDLGPGLKLRLGGGATLANQAWAQTRYGVTSAQAASSGNAMYTPAGGLQDVHASAGLSYTLAPRVTLSTSVTARRLLNDAQDSPLVRKPSPVTGLVAVSYGF